LYRPRVSCQDQRPLTSASNSTHGSGEAFAALQWQYSGDRRLLGTLLTRAYAHVVTSESSSTRKWHTAAAATSTLRAARTRRRGAAPTAITSGYVNLIPDESRKTIMTSDKCTQRTNCQHTS